MIISHRHRFIYVKARKVAGTSVEVALAKHCGDADIVTPVGGFSPKWDEDEYERHRLRPATQVTRLPMTFSGRRGTSLWRISMPT